MFLMPLLIYGKSLLDLVVMADTVNQFKHRLDKYWKNYDFVHDHWAAYTGTGGRF